MTPNSNRRQPLGLATMLALVFGAAVSLGAWNPARAQFGGGGGGVAPAEVKSFSLEHADVNNVANTLNLLFADGRLGFTARIAVDEASNRILVGAPEEQMHRIEEVLKSLDVAPAQKQASELKIFPLQHAQADQIVMFVLDLVADRTAKIAVDARTNSILVSATPEKQKLAETLLKYFDQEQPEKLETEQRVRVVWLVSGLSRDDAAVPPEDLAEVVEELGRLGVRDLRMAAQTILTTLGQQRRFQVQCAAVLDKPCTLSIEGMVTKTEDTSSEFQLVLNAFGESQSGSTSGQLCQLETTIRAPLGHSVVLGVTPIGRMTSVFVVQLMPAE